MSRTVGDRTAVASDGDAGDWPADLTALSMDDLVAVDNAAIRRVTRQLLEDRGGDVIAGWSSYVGPPSDQE